MASIKSSTLVNVAEDAEIRLVRWLVNQGSVASTFGDACEQCIVRADAAALVKTIVADAGAMGALLTSNADEAVSAFSLLAALLEKAPQMAGALASSVESTATEANVSMRRITLLSALYNTRVEGSEKCKLLTTMYRLAAQDCPELLGEGQPLGKWLVVMEESSVPLLASMVGGWSGVGSDDKRKLFEAVADGLPDPLLQQRFRLLLVETYTDASETDAAGLSAAKAAAVGAIQDPVSLFMQQRSMLSMPAVQALATNTDTKVLHGLLTVFQEGKLEDYHAFLKKNGGADKVLAPWGLEEEKCVRHMRILSVCSLAGEHEEIPYSSIASTLQLPSDKEVESWVIAAVSSGLLAAKMDQLQQKVMVERSVVRKFDMDQWRALQSQLNLWKQNLKGILDAFQQQSLSSSSPPLPGGN